MMNQKISIALCTYNGSLFVKEQLMSLFEQTYPIWEIVVVDDKSTDNTVEIISAFAKESDINIKIYENEVTLGYNKNFEKACKLSKGELIAICDQDDIWDKNKLKLLVENWNNSTLLIYCDSIRFTQKPPETPKRSKLMQRISGSNTKQLCLINTISGHNILFKRELLNLCLPFPNDFYYDWWLAVVAMANGGICHLSEYLVFQRVHSNNATVDITIKETKKHIVENIKRVLSKQLPIFINIPNLNKKDLEFYKTFNLLWFKKKTFINKIILFCFFVKNGRDIFSYKVRKFPWFSYIKHSYRIATNGIY